MRLLAFSDIHGNIQALQRFMERIQHISFDRIAFLGDIFGYYYYQEQCIELLNQIPNLIWIKGNHDKYAIETYYGIRDEDELITLYGHSYENIRYRFTSKAMDSLNCLPETYTLRHNNTCIGLFHGSPWDPLEGRIYPDTKFMEKDFEGYDFVIVGHTHCKIDRKVGSTRIVSPGSLGQPRDGRGHGFLILDFSREACEFVNIDININQLRMDIDSRDSDLCKLYEVLEREK